MHKRSSHQTFAKAHGFAVSHDGAGKTICAWQPPARLSIIYVLFSLLLALGLGGCSTFRMGNRPTPTPIALPPSATGGQPARQDFTVTRGEIVNYVTYSGKTVLAVQEDLYFQQSGRIAQVLVNDGDHVEAGALIATLDAEMLDLDLQAAQLTLDRALQQLAEAEQNLQFDRQNAELALEIVKLRQANGSETESPILARQVQQAEIARQRLPEKVSPIVQMNVESAQLALKRIQKSLDDARIVAPIAGEIRFVQPLDPEHQPAVSAYAPVVQIVDLDSLQVELNLTRAQLEPLREGMELKILLAGQTVSALHGVIQTLPRPFGSGNGPLVLVKIQEQADAVRLYEGSAVDVQIELARKADALLLPVEALYGFSGQYFVRAVEGTAQRAVDVEIGIQNSQFVEIVAGVEEGTLVSGRE